jgi:hypothetical protein
MVPPCGPIGPVGAAEAQPEPELLPVPLLLPELLAPQEL